METWLWEQARPAGHSWLQSFHPSLKLWMFGALDSHAPWQQAVASSGKQSVFRCFSHGRKSGWLNFSGCTLADPLPAQVLSHSHDEVKISESQFSHLESSELNPCHPTAPWTKKPCLRSSVQYITKSRWRLCWAAQLSTLWRKPGWTYLKTLKKNIEKTLKKHGTYLKVTAHIGIVRNMAMDCGGMDMADMDKTRMVGHFGRL